MKGSRYLCDAIIQSCCCVPFSHFVILGQSPNNVDSHSDMCGSHIRTGRIHRDPGGSWQEKHINISIRAVKLGCQKKINATNYFNAINACVFVVLGRPVVSERIEFKIPSTSWCWQPRSCSPLVADHTSTPTGRPSGVVMGIMALWREPDLMAPFLSKSRSKEPFKRAVLKGAGLLGLSAK